MEVQTMETSTIAQQKQKEFSDRIYKACSKPLLLPRVQLIAPPLMEVKTAQQLIEEEGMEILQQPLE